MQMLELLSNSIMGINDVTRMWPNQTGVKGQKDCFFFEKSILNVHTKRLLHSIFLYIWRRVLSVELYSNTE